LANPHFLPETGLSQQPVSRKAANIPLQAGSHCSDALNFSSQYCWQAFCRAEQEGAAAAVGSVKQQANAICAKRRRLPGNRTGSRLAAVWLRSSTVSKRGQKLRIVLDSILQIALQFIVAHTFEIDGILDVRVHRRQPRFFEPDSGSGSIKAEFNWLRSVLVNGHEQRVRIAIERVIAEDAFDLGRRFRKGRLALNCALVFDAGLTAAAALSRQ
jgi:hypothetical protein